MFQYLLTLGAHASNNYSLRFLILISGSLFCNEEARRMFVANHRFIDWNDSSENRVFLFWYMTRCAVRCLVIEIKQLHLFTFVESQVPIDEKNITTSTSSIVVWRFLVPLNGEVRKARGDCSWSNGAVVGEERGGNDTAVSISHLKFNIQSITHFKQRTFVNFFFRNLHVSRWNGRALSSRNVSKNSLVWNAFKL